MSGIVGDTWCMRDNLTDIEWAAKTSLSEAAKSIDPGLSFVWESQIRKALSKDVELLPASPDIYGFGKELARMARLALIADEMGESPSVVRT